MPRRTRAQGRPGTQVFPTRFEQSHAVVVAKSFTAKIRFYDQAHLPVANADLSYPEPGESGVLYEGGCRIQALNAAEASALVGDQRQVTAAYLVAVDYDAPVSLNAVGIVFDSTDPTLVEDGRRLIVDKIARGSIRWERDLFCTDDMTATVEEA